MPGGKKVYSKRYPPAPETMEIIHTQQSAEERATTKKSFDEFLRRIETESTYVLIPERIDRGKHFVALAIELSQKYEIDIDIWQMSYFIEVNLHLFCSSYPSELTRYIAELLTLCDRFCSFIFPQEPSDFTLSLEFDTHKYYLSGKLINE